MKRWTLFALALAGFGCACVLGGAAWPTGRAEGPQFNAAGELVLPSDYREWVFVGTGLGMTYGAAARPADRPLVFDNIYVTPEAYRAFVRSGAWPEGTMFIMEGRGSVTRPLLANVGITQGDPAFLEASVKDSKRFADTKWGYFDFGPARTPRASAARLPRAAECYACHSENTAVENTFVQFYPALLEVARSRGTVKASFDPNKRF